MSSDFSSFSAMGVSDSDAIFSAENDISPVECRFVLRKSTASFRRECLNSYSTVKEREDEEDKIKSSSSESFPSSSAVNSTATEEESAVREEEEDGFKTPTSMDHKIQTILPPAPIKPKSRQPSKRKAHSRDRVLIDLSTEIESMFPWVFDQCKNKKSKKANENE